MIVGVVVLLVIGAVGVVVGLVNKRRIDIMSNTVTVACAEVVSLAGQGEPVPCEVAGPPSPRSGL